MAITLRFNETIHKPPGREVVRPVLPSRLMWDGWWLADSPKAHNAKLPIPVKEHR